jgi:hypothetical protein
MKLFGVSVGDKIMIYSRIGRYQAEVASVGKRSVKTVNGNSYSIKTGDRWGRHDSYNCARKIPVN